MKTQKINRLAVAFSAALLLGATSAAYAQSPSTASGQNSTSPTEARRMAEQKLQGYGLTDIKLKQLKHGFSGTAMKDGKPVHVEVTDSGETRIK